MTTVCPGEPCAEGMDSDVAASCPVGWGGDGRNPQCAYTVGLTDSHHPRLAEDSHGSRLKTELGGKVSVGGRPCPQTSQEREWAGRRAASRASFVSSPQLQNSAHRPPPCPADLATNPGRCHLKE